VAGRELRDLSHRPLNRLRGTPDQACMDHFFSVFPDVLITLPRLSNVLSIHTLTQFTDLIILSISLSTHALCGSAGQPAGPLGPRAVSAAGGGSCPRMSLDTLGRVSMPTRPSLITVIQSMLRSVCAFSASLPLRVQRSLCGVSLPCVEAMRMFACPHWRYAPIQ